MSQDQLGLLGSSFILRLLKRWSVSAQGGGMESVQLTAAAQKLSARGAAGPRKLLLTQRALYVLQASCPHHPLPPTPRTSAAALPVTSRTSAAPPAPPRHHTHLPLYILQGSTCQRRLSLKKLGMVSLAVPSDDRLSHASGGVAVTPGIAQAPTPPYHTEAYHTLTMPHTFTMHTP